jgi:NADPH2:quinone reductase
MRPQLFGYMVTREESRKWWNEVFDLVEKKVIK